MDKCNLEKLISQGFSFSQMSELLNCSPTKVFRWAKKYNLKTKHPKSVTNPGGISRETLENLISKGFSARKMSEQLNCRTTKIEYWLKTFNLKTLNRRRQRFIGTKKICDMCNIAFPVCEFYKRKKRKNYDSICKKCRSKKTNTLGRKLKIQSIEYKGNKCQICGYNKYSGALEFHHVDPSKKEYNISHTRFSMKKRKKELDKCVLVCSNCHREIHGGVINIKDFIYGLPLTKNTC